MNSDYMKPFLVICGMHRSGTSFLSRALNLSGVYLGDLDSLISNEWVFFEDNKKGHWEHKKILELSEKTLSNSNGTWEKIPKQIKVDDDVEKDVRKCIENLYDHPSIASGFKDPRILLLLDSWKDFLPNDFIIIGIFRNPLKVAESLKKRNNFDYKKSLKLWQIYNQNLLKYLETYGGFLINFDWPKEKIFAEIKLINKKIGLDENIELSDWFSEDLLHSDKTHDSKYELSNDLKLIQKQLEERSNQNNLVKLHSIPIYPKKFLDMLHGKTMEIKNQGDYFKKIQNNFKIQNNKLNQLNEEFDERTAWALELGSKIQDKDNQLKKLTKEFDERTAWALQLDKDNKQTNTIIHNFQEQITSKESQIRDFQEQITSKESQIRDFQEQITSKESQIRDFQEQITSKESQLRDFQEQITSKESQLRDFQKNFYLMQNELEGVKNSFLLKIPLAIMQQLNRSFPPSTKRGEFLRLSKMALSTLQNEGIDSLCQALQEKIKRQRLLSRNSFFKTNKNNFSELLKIGDTSHTNIIQGTKNIKLDNALRNFLNVKYSGISNMNVFPKISIIIATFDQVEYLNKNLLSIENKTSYKNFEIIIVTNNLDENSEMRQFLKIVKHRVYIFEKEYSFSGMNNYASQYADGDFLLFLNDDIEVVTTSWLEHMLKLAMNDKVGAVGPKLLFPNGTLQEAGGIIWKDGIIWNYGRNKNPDDPEFNYVRSVDYCSGCCLMIKTKLFEELGKFDTRYSPAYCEDADLCLAIQKEGLSILYQPLSILIHYEGKTSGTALKSGIKSYQIKNQKKFRIKWNSFLNSRLNDSQNNTFLERNRKNGINILYIDHYVPEYDKDAGSLLVYYLLSILSFMNHKVTFWPDNQVKSEPYAENLQQKGINIISGNKDFKSFIKKYANDFQICIMTRAHIAPKYLDLIKKHAPNCKVIYDTVDLHFIREFREATLKQDSSKQFLAEKTKEQELKIFHKSDIVITKSLEEAHFLLKEDPSLTVSIIPTFDLPPDDFPSYDERQHLLFLGGFQHPPNIDSLTHLIKNLYPKIRQHLPDVKLYVIGSNPTQEMIDMCSKVDGVIFLGYVQDLDLYLKKCRLLLAPLRFGAGVKGKITQSLAYGLVVVTTLIGSEGISNKNDKLLITTSDDEFVKKSISVYNDKEFWTALSLNSIKYSESNFSPEYIRDTLDQVIKRCLKN